MKRAFFHRFFFFVAIILLGCAQTKEYIPNYPKDIWEKINAMSNITGAFS